jgi:thiol-disulfide isomerase/thioredoxin
MRALIIPVFLFTAFVAQAQSPRILVNHVGYEQNKAKRAIIESDTREPITAFQLVDDSTGKIVYTGKPMYSGPVAKWKHWQFYTLEFSAYTKPGVYRLTAAVKNKPTTSYPFVIARNVLEKYTLSDILYYFKGQRSAGLIDQADHHLQVPKTARNPNAPASPDTLDLHGGWYDATGDYGIHLSHLTFSSYFNPQQVPMVLYSLLKTNQLLTNRTGTDYRQFLRRIMDESTFGADYLVRLQAPGGSFYRSIGAPGAAKAAKDRSISPEQQSYRIKQSKDQSFGGDRTVNDWRSYQCSFRSGGGMAIAALAMASMTGISGDFSNARYLQAAEDAFAFLEKENPAMTNDGKENIVDDYCALAAATELYKATRADKYRSYAEKRANQLAGRLTSSNQYSDYWRADNADRPFFHPSDAGLPLVTLLYYYPYATMTTQASIQSAIHRSLEHELAVTHEVNNPFGYSRQLVQDTLGHRRTSFFFPHGSEASPWWQGEDARLGSMAAAARLSIPLFATDKNFTDSLETFAIDQLNWILGLNPYNASMLQGTGHNNPAYAFFGTFEYTNAPGGIVNGITGGLDDEEDIDFNLSYAMTGKDNDWRWAEQWLPHDAWYLLAIASGQPLQELATTIDAEHINDYPTLTIGAPTPDFNLPATDGRNYSLKDFKDAKVLVVVFMCNHCPTSQAYEKRLIQMTNEYAAKGVRFVGISPNAPSALRIDELGYSDVGDGFDDMKTRAKNAGYNFPYLYDGEKETASKLYGPISTPHIFIFDAQRRLCYNGRIDDQENPAKTPQSLDARNAIDALLAGKEPPVAVTKTFGCSIKWIEKSNWIQKATFTWAHEPVHLEGIDTAAVKNLVRNDTKKLRLINLWATWCVPCVQEYPQLVALNRMYRDRGFELVSISMDDSARRPRALAFLEKQECSSPNFIYTNEDKYKLMETVDPHWQGALPYSLLVEPGGKIIYAKQGTIDPEQLRKLIFDSPYMGRIFKN